VAAVAAAFVEEEGLSQAPLAVIVATGCDVRRNQNIQANRTGELLFGEEGTHSRTDIIRPAWLVVSTAQLQALPLLM
jgi:hypothetical protein